ncbi:hypothetical protein F3Y22_tig00109972pilonHSYRG00064 [Hibiscus syriacus]|uniref:Uncharacterized protein n=1 Tax=Hibiscus syriacus TaxID=106335 RepID=A0A6A3BR55_HIBSY|nr:hypothetical protein F3Y22_tig00109972pilonHSYRG00064 [Hibiscus syriacus]
MEESHRYIVFKIDENRGLSPSIKSAVPAKAMTISLLHCLPMTADMPCLISISSPLITAAKARSSSLHGPQRHQESEQKAVCNIQRWAERVLDGISYEVQATDPTEMGIDVIKDKAN